MRGRLEQQFMDILILGSIVVDRNKGELMIFVRKVEYRSVRIGLQKLLICCFFYLLFFPFDKPFSHLRLLFLIFGSDVLAENGIFRSVWDDGGGLFVEDLVELGAGESPQYWYYHLIMMENKLQIFIAYSVFLVYEFI